MKKKKVSIADKALTNAVKKGEISLSNLPRSKRNIVKSIAKTTSDDDLERASKNKYKYSRRKVKHISKNESLEGNFKRIITKLEDWNNTIKNLHERNVPNYEIDEIDEIDEITSDDEYFDDDEKINDIKMEKKFIKKFSNFSKINESDKPSEPKMYPKENKFKRIIEYSDDIEESLLNHNFIKAGGEGDFVIFDLMDKSYQLVGDMVNDIRPCGPDEFDHMMNNL